MSDPASPRRSREATRQAWADRLAPLFDEILARPELRAPA